jgi:hypothetical protein
VKVLLKDAKNPNGQLVVPVSVNIVHIDDVSTNDGEAIYVLEFLCGALDSDGNPIETVIINNVSAEDVKAQIEVGLDEIGRQIDWPNQQDDEYAPRVVEIFPKANSTDVPISSHVFGTLKEFFPTTGIDPSTIKLKVNGIDVTSDLQLSGEEVEYKFRWIPSIR